MRYTILIATLSAVVASVLTTAAISGSFFGADTASSASTPAELVAAVSPGGVTSILQGDINCDGVVDGHDTLGGLRFLGELDVPQTEPCPDVGTLAAIPGPAGPAGPQGPAGPAGPQGDEGPPGVSGYELVTEDFLGLGGSNTIGIGRGISCPDGKRVLAGGGDILGAGGDIFMRESYPASDGTEWAVSWRSESGSFIDDKDFRLYAICANVAE